MIDKQKKKKNLGFEKDERAKHASHPKPISPQGCAPERQGGFF